MPITGAVHTGTNAAVQLSTLVRRKSFKQLDFKAGDANTVNAYIGPSTVTAAGADAFIALPSDGDWGAKSVNEEDLQQNWDDLYVVASTGELVHIVLVT